MKVFVNANQRVTAIDGQTVYEVWGSLGDAFAIVETWLRGHPNREGATREQYAAGQAVEALIRAHVSPANRTELEAHDDPRLRIFNQQVNPTGRAGSSQWAICR